MTTKTPGQVAYEAMRDALFRRDFVFLALSVSPTWEDAIHLKSEWEAVAQAVLDSAGYSRQRGLDG